jgi:hypothetical protein
MKNKEPVRNGTFSDADLAADCDERANNLEANLPALEGEGMTAKMITDFRADTLAFRQLPTDENLAKLVTVAVGKRDTALEAARTGLRQAAKPIGRAFGDESPEYHGLAVGEVSRKTVMQVLNLLLTVPGAGAAYIDDAKAKAEGFNEARLTALKPLYDDLFQLEAKVAAAETAAQKGTRTRVLTYNALNTTCSAYCARGYDHFVELDENLTKLFVRNPASQTVEEATPPEA